jgi:3-oxoacyl-[acyl-carrier protein] reductase
MRVRYDITITIFTTTAHTKIHLLTGMGRRLTGALLRDGHDVMATDISAEKLREVAKSDGWYDFKGRVSIQTLDVTKRSQWERAIGRICEEFSGIDVLMNIAGVLVPKKIQDASFRDIDLHVDVMVKGVAIGTKIVADLMIQSKTKGHIINVSSMAAVAPVSGVTMYACAKYAARGFSLAASKDLAPHGIAVTCFMPDAVQTPMVDLQLNYEGGAYAYSGKILSLDDVTRSILNNVLPNRPVEVWLSPRKSVVGCCGLGGMLAGVIHSSRLVKYEEQRMLQIGLRRQCEILKKKIDAVGRHGDEEKKKKKKGA